MKDKRFPEFAGESLTVPEQKKRGKPWFLLLVNLYPQL
jgi:hypothetical protein